MRLLELLRERSDIETHLVLSRAGALNVGVELDIGRGDLESLAHVVHSDRNIAASIASGSYRTEAMIIAPCSMKTLAAIASGVTDSLISRAADVVLKERRRLILVARESPLHLVHLRNMTTVTEMGGIIFPPAPAFYAGIRSLEDMIDQTASRILDLLNIDSPLLRRWSGLEGNPD